MATRKRNHPKTNLTPRTRLDCHHRPGKLTPDQRHSRTLFDPALWSKKHSIVSQPVFTPQKTTFDVPHAESSPFYCGGETAFLDLVDCASMGSPPPYIDASPSSRRTLRPKNINSNPDLNRKLSGTISGASGSGAGSGHLRRSAGLFNLDVASTSADEFMKPPAKPQPLKRPHPFDTNRSTDDFSKSRLLTSSLGASPARGRPHISPLNGPGGPRTNFSRPLSSPTPTPINPVRTRPFGSLPMGRGKGAATPNTSAPHYLTPENSYRGVKPLQTAFTSTGLLSKRDLPQPSSPVKAPPETPRKRMPAGPSSAGSAALNASFSSSNRSLFGLRRRSHQKYEQAALQAPDPTTDSLPDSIRRFSLGPETPSTPTPIEPMYTSTPAPARRQMSDASTITPGFNNRMWPHVSQSSRTSLLLNEPSRFEDTLDMSTTNYTSFDDEFEYENEHSLTSSELGSPRTPDIIMHDEEPALVGSSSMESTNSQPQRSRRQALPVRISKNLFAASTETLTPAPKQVGCLAGDVVPPMPPLPSCIDENEFLLAPVQTPMRANVSAVLSDVNESSRAEYPTTDSLLMERYDKVSLLGEGEFSVVYLATPPSDPAIKLAIKRTKRPLSGSRTRQSRMEEVQILKRLASTVDQDEDSENVIQMLDWWEADRHLYIVTEWCENGNLATFLSESGRVGRLDEWRVWKILSELAHGLRYIHDHDVLHLDLKPANIFVTFAGVLKIGDFGMATNYPAAQDIEREGDREYIAPEILAERFYSKPADIFSLGLMMVEIAANIVLPDNGVHWHKLRSGDLSDAGRLSSGDLTEHSGRDKTAAEPPAWAPYFLVDGSRALDKLVGTMLRPDPRQRPRAADILNTAEVRLVDARRGAGAIVWEGDFGPEPGADSEASRVR